jgi:reactive intermediate/imine deaminase
MQHSTGDSKPRILGAASNVPAPTGTYSHAIVAAGFTFLSGQNGADPVTGELPDGIAAQTVGALNNLGAVLRGLGLGLTDVVRVTAFLSDTADFDGFDAAYRSTFGEHRPVRTTVGARLYGELVEIDAIAFSGCEPSGH